MTGNEQTSPADIKIGLRQFGVYLKIPDRL